MRRPQARPPSCRGRPWPASTSLHRRLLGPCAWWEAREAQEVLAREVLAGEVLAREARLEPLARWAPPAQQLLRWEQAPLVAPAACATGRSRASASSRPQAGS